MGFLLALSVLATHPTYYVTLSLDAGVPVGLLHYAMRYTDSRDPRLNPVADSGAGRRAPADSGIGQPLGSRALAPSRPTLVEPSVHAAGRAGRGQFAGSNAPKTFEDYGIAHCAPAGPRVGFGPTQASAAQ